MSKLNECHVYGLINAPKFEYNENNNPISASFTVHTVRRKSGGAETDVSTGQDDILFFTKEADKIQILQHISNAINKLPDETYKYAVECYGTLITRRVDLTTICKECNKEFDEKIYYSYVRPTVINLDKSALSVTKQSNYLKRMREKSNSITLIGTVSHEPFTLNNAEEKIGEDGEKIFEPVENEDLIFPLAVTRNYPLIEDPIGRTDYPLIAAKTLDAEIEQGFIQKGHNLLIRGSIWLKKINRIHTCPHCGRQHPVKDEITMIFPYNLEFLFSTKNRYAIGAAMKAIDEDTQIIITQNGEKLSTIKNVKAIQKEEYKEVRQDLYPRIIRKITPVRKGIIEFEIEGRSLIGTEDES